MPKQLFTRSPRGRPGIRKSSSVLPARPLSLYSTESAISKISPQFEGSVPNSLVIQGPRKQELQQQKVLTAYGDRNGLACVTNRRLGSC